MNSRPAKYPPLSPHLSVSDSRQAIAFYQAAFDAKELYHLSDPESGRVGHAEIILSNGAHLMLVDENPAWHNTSPLTLGGTTFKLCLMVENADTAVARAVAAGATVEMPPCDMFYGFRCASIRDPFGHQWLIQHEIENVTPAEMQRRWDDMAKSGKSA